MSVLEIDKIDAIGIDKEQGNVVLTISDHLDWDDVNSHLHILQKKINNYLEFIEGGQIYESYPLANNKNIEIHVKYQYELPHLALDFYEKIKSVLILENITLLYKNL